MSHASQVDAPKLAEVWADPVLRYSNVLDGLFHRVVLAEGDRDCRFFENSLSALDQEFFEFSGSEVLFVPTGGKDALAKVARALLAVDVTVVASPDLDILENEASLKALVAALGGTWDEELARLYRVATEEFRAPRAPALVRHVRDAIAAALEPHLDERYASAHRDAVMANLRISESPWRALKRYGQAAFRAAHGEATLLLDALERRGVVVVRVGELENFAPSAGRKGSGWVPAALAAEAHLKQPAQDHVRALLRAAARATT